MKNSSLISSLLAALPGSTIAPPVETKLQVLPFGELSWPDFETLCLRFVNDDDDIQDCQPYGKEGNEQGGIDIYSVKQDGTYAVYQCRRVQTKSYGPKKIQQTISDFLDGEWASSAKEFVLMTRADLSLPTRVSEINKQRKRLGGKKIKLRILDEKKFSLAVKEKPKIVYDFFGLEWVKIFCGEEALHQIKHRLNPRELASLETQLLSFYNLFLNTQDSCSPVIPGIPKLKTRYVIPGVDISKTIHSVSVIKNSKTEGTDQTKTEFESTAATNKARVNIFQWLNYKEKTILIGDPGSGKSSFLRYLAPALLEGVEVVASVIEKRGKVIPIYLPFSLLTRNDTVDLSISEAMEKWLKSYDNLKLWPFLQKALEDERAFLLIDGLDEWIDEVNAHKAFDKLILFIEQKKVSVLVSTRKSGFDRFYNQLGDWQTGEIGDLTIPDKRQLINTIFNEHVSVDLKTEAVLSELSQSSDLVKISSNPLILTFLLSIKLQGKNIPHNKYAALSLIT